MRASTGRRILRKFASFADHCEVRHVSTIYCGYKGQGTEYLVVNIPYGCSRPEPNDTSLVNHNSAVVVVDITNITRNFLHLERSHQHDLYRFSVQAAWFRARIVTSLRNAKEAATEVWFAQFPEDPTSPTTPLKTRICRTFSLSIIGAWQLILRA